ncbi:MAG TPA: RidA family protein [Candidatus Acidoferrum sp.]|jgi:2-iminobutanoate/2-iminopropanoate deaminase|nr:RidA family protein [Candidatus Acidoferrum sp.]
MKGKSLFLLIGFFMGAALSGTAQNPPARRLFKASNPSLEKQGLPVPYSDAALVGNTLYIAGRTGIDPKSGVIPQDPEQEIRFLLDSFKTALTKGGMTTDDVVMVQVHCPDLSLYNKFNALYLTYFSKQLPPRAFLGSGPLLGGAHFEMLGVAVKP